MKESEGKRKEVGDLKASCHFIDEQKRSPITVFSWAYILPHNNKNYQNQKKQLIVTRTKWEEIKRGIKRQKFKWATGTVSQG